MSYNIWKKYFKIHKKFWLLFIEVKTDEDDFKSIKLPLLKKITTRIYRILKYLKFIWKANWNLEISKIEEIINSKLKNENEKDLADKFFYNINYNKLLNIFNNEK
jgi:hypothetical protein